MIWAPVIWRLSAISVCLSAPLLLAACSERDSSDRDAAANSPSAAAEQLDAVALDSGALPRADEDPAGRYGRRYEGGVDRLCVVPDADEGPGHYRFGAETMIGQDEYCRGRGKARLSGNKLLMRFEGSGGCLIVAHYQGDRLVLPGALDMSCELLCSGRGSFAAVSFPRIDRDPAAAGEMRDARKDLLCR